MHEQEYTPAAPVTVAPFRRRFPLTMRDLYAFSIGSAYAVTVIVLLRLMA